MKHCPAIGFDDGHPAIPIVAVCSRCRLDDEGAHKSQDHTHSWIGMTWWLLCPVHAAIYEVDWSDAFSLIEVLVVLLIIGILLAIAIPTFLSVTKTANNTAAQANLQTAMTTAMTYFDANSMSFTDADAGGGGTSTITQLGSGLTYVGAKTDSTAVGTVSVWIPDAATGSAIVLTAYSPGTRTCWGMARLTGPTTSAIEGQTADGVYYFSAAGPACSAELVNPSNTQTGSYPS